jgi:raffinose/stachyose/melibiose transport system permease protein
MHGKTEVESVNQKIALQNDRKKNILQKLYHSKSIINVMYIPCLILFLVFYVYPFIQGIKLSFTNWDGFSQTYQWIGWENYKMIFSDIKVHITFKNTFIYAIGSTVFQNIIGLSYALLLNNNSLKFQSVARAVVFLPGIISSLILGYIWNFIFLFNGGALNDIVHLFGGDSVNWLGNVNYNVWLITFVNTFQYVGISMIIYLAGLQTISKEYYEAANIDGASTLSKFFYITFPLLAPSITVNIVLNIIGGFKLFDTVIAMTGGGPGYSSNSIATLMYQLYFGLQQAGYSSAIGVVMFIIVILISVFCLGYLRRREIG